MELVLRWQKMHLHFHQEILFEQCNWNNFTSFEASAVFPSESVSIFSLCSKLQMRLIRLCFCLRNRLCRNVTFAAHFMELCTVAGCARKQRLADKMKTQGDGKLTCALKLKNWREVLPVQLISPCGSDGWRRQRTRPSSLSVSWWWAKNLFISRLFHIILYIWEPWDQICNSSNVLIFFNIISTWISPSWAGPAVLGRSELGLVTPGCLRMIWIAFFSLCFWSWNHIQGKWTKVRRGSCEMGFCPSLQTISVAEAWIVYWLIADLLLLNLFIHKFARLFFLLVADRRICFTSSGLFRRLNTPTVWKQSALSHVLRNRDLVRAKLPEIPEK